MGRYTGEIEGVRLDELQAAGEGVPALVQNIRVSSDCTLHRGDLMAATSANDVFAAATASDAGKMLAIVRDDFTADADHKVCAAYVSGRFYREKINGGEAEVVNALELELKRQNIFLTSLKA